MSSGGWELVGKNKKDKSGGKAAKLTKAEKKKFIENAPKVEDFLPLSQVKTLYDNLDGNKENKKPAKEKEHKTKENEEKKKQQKLQQQQQAEKKKQEPKGKPPKTIKDALNMIDSMEFSNILINVQTRYPGAPLIWLKDLSAFLNAKIPLDKEDPVFSGKPKDYPLSLVPAGILCILEKAIDMAGQQNAQLFYEITFTAMTTDMAKGVPVIGHKIFLQLLARSNPEMTVASIPKLISLRNSYQNRKPIGLSLLWALSQGGDENLAVGLKIWHEIMSSLLPNKTYASYVVQILNDLVFGHENSCDLNPELYFNIIEDSYSGKSNVPVHLGRELHLSIEKLRSILFKNKDINYSKLFEILLGKINQKINSNYRDELIKALADCLATEPRCFNIWESVYSKNLYQSNLLLIYLNTQWNTLRSALKPAVVKETLLAFQTINERWKKGKEDNFVHSCNKICKTLLEKMTVSTQRRFPWRKGSIFLLLLISAILAFDCRKHGSFEASNTGRFLKTSGINAYGQKVWSTTKAYTFKGLEYVEATSPEYYKSTVDFCKPYVKLAGDFYIVAKKFSYRIYNNTATYVDQNGPVVEATIEHYFPGMLKEIRVRSIQGLELVKVYSTYIGQQVIDHSSKMIKWLSTNVFVGKLSPESLQGYAYHAIDTTQNFASQTYDWVYEKVQTLSKVP